MNQLRLYLIVAGMLAGFPFAGTAAPTPIPTAADQPKMLTSADPILARNKRLVYDLWRITISAGHVERTPEFMAEDFHDTNPGIPPGRAGYMSVLSKVLKPRPIPDTITGLINVFAEGDYVILAFQREWSEAAIMPGGNRPPFSFELFRVKDGLVVEHWDSQPSPAKGAGAPGNAAPPPLNQQK